MLCAIPLPFPHLHHRPSFVAFPVVGSTLVAQTIEGVTAHHTMQKHSKGSADIRQCRVTLG